MENVSNVQTQLQVIRQRCPRSALLSLIPSFVGHTAAFTIANGDTAGLIAVIHQANAASGKDEINLAANGTYTFNAIDNEVIEIVNGQPAAFGANAMPQIDSNITINGNGATIQRDPLFSSCNASNELRMFWINGGGKLTLNNVKVKNGCVGDYGSGGAVFARDGGTLSVIGSSFDSNKTTGTVLDGGAITVNGGFLFVENSQFMANSSTYLGGAISLDSSTGVIYASTFTSNTNTSSGGAVAAETNSDVTIYNSTFTANSANHGGAVISRDASKMRLSGVTFIGNTTVFDGGAVENGGGLMIINNSTFTGNSGSAAGAVNNDNVTGGKMYIFNSTFSDNTANSFGGGAINNGGDELVVVDTTFTNNRSDDTDFGGGTLYHFLGKATLTNVTITGSSTDADGGAIYSSGDFLNITGSTISNNTASSGGALETYTTETTIHSSTLSDNTADNGEFFFRGAGGAIVSQEKMTIVNSTLDNNTSSGYESGGDVYKGGGAIFASNNAAQDPTVTIINSTISGNSTQTDGGAIFVDEAGELNLQNVTITGNSAAGNGGGLARIVDEFFPVAAPVITGSIIVGNGTDCDSSPFTSGGNNVVGSSCTNLTGDTVSDNAASILNTLLANNGGFTSTHALIAGSPALDKVNTGCPAGDQRGFTRTTPCDAGAFELDAQSNTIPGVAVSPSGGSTQVSESGTTDNYTIALASAPTGLVTINIITDGETTVSPSTLIFTTQNWNAPQTVTVSAFVDFLIEAEHTSTIAHVVTSTDTTYNAAPANNLLVNISADGTGGGETPTPTETGTGPTETPVATETPEPEGELTDNGGFEQPGMTNGEAAEWQVKNATKDKRKCDKPGKDYSHSGACAFLFKGSVGENSQVVQKLTGLALQPGDMLSVNAWVSGKSAVAGGQVSVKIKYSDDTKGKFSLDVPTSTYAYQQISAAPFAVEKAVATIKLAVRNRSTSGSFLIDNVSMVHSPVNGFVGADGLLALPTEGSPNGRQ